MQGSGHHGGQAGARVLTSDEGAAPHTISSRARSNAFRGKTDGNDARDRQEFFTVARENEKQRC